MHLNLPESLWLSVSPSFCRLDQELLRHLSQRHRVARWRYAQTPDEPSSLAVALTLLHDYLKGCDRPLHLIGHSTAGLLGLLYARKYPRRVKSLTLLAVGVHPTVDWKAHYYTQLEQLPCSRTMILSQVVYALFGKQPRQLMQGWIQLLERDLMESLSLHSPCQPFSLFPQGVDVPLLVCGSQNDAIVDPTQIQGWQPWLKPGDRLWLAPGGRHFFHADYAFSVSREILDFWGLTAAGAIAPTTTKSSCSSTDYYDAWF